MIVISDVDECSHSRVLCDQMCINEVGSFHCDCKTGYTLSDNGITCKGISNSLCLSLILIL